MKRAFETSGHRAWNPISRVPYREGMGLIPVSTPATKKKGTGLKENREVEHINRQTNDGAMPVPGWVPLKQE